MFGWNVITGSATPHLISGERDARRGGARADGGACADGAGGDAAITTFSECFEAAAAKLLTVKPTILTLGSVRVRMASSSSPGCRTGGVSATWGKVISFSRGAGPISASIRALRLSAPSAA